MLPTKWNKCKNLVNYSGHVGRHLCLSNSWLSEWLFTSELICTVGVLNMNFFFLSSSKDPTRNYAVSKDFLSFLSDLFPDIGDPAISLVLREILSGNSHSDIISGATVIPLAPPGPRPCSLDLTLLQCVQVQGKGPGKIWTVFKTWKGMYEGGEQFRSWKYTVLSVR